MATWLVMLTVSNASRMRVSSYLRRSDIERPHRHSPTSFTTCGWSDVIKRSILLPHEVQDQAASMPLRHTGRWPDRLRFLRFPRPTARRNSSRCSRWSDGTPGPRSRMIPNWNGASPQHQSRYGAISISESPVNADKLQGIRHQIVDTLDCQVIDPEPRQRHCAP